jgi:hypothetical protein
MSVKGKDGKVTQINAPIRNSTSQRKRQEQNELAGHGPQKGHINQHAEALTPSPTHHIARQESSHVQNSKTMYLKYIPMSTQ